MIYAIGLTVGVIFVAGMMAGGSIYHSVTTGRDWRSTLMVYAASVVVLGGFVMYVAMTS